MQAGTILDRGSLLNDIAKNQEEMSKVPEKVKAEASQWFKTQYAVLTKKDLLKQECDWF